MSRHSISTVVDTTDVGEMKAGGSQVTARLESLDQFRGYTVAGMFLVNFLGSYSLVTDQFPNLKHHNTFCSYADTIMPQFFFAVGFGYRLTLLKRLQRDGWWQAYGRVLQRIIGLLFIAMLAHGLDGQYKSWSELEEAGWWRVLSGAFGRNYFQTLTHIALASLWVTPVIAAAGWVRLVYFIFSAILHLLISYNGYYQWVNEYRGIDGGYFGFISWALVVLVGSFAYDMVSRGEWLLRRMLSWSFVLMVLGYGLSCLNRVTIPNQELWQRDWLLFFNNPPFCFPAEPVNLWTMSQRAGSVSYMVFSAGFSLLVFAIAVWLADLKKIRLGLFRTLGVNALAGYVLHDWVNGVVRPFFPKDCPITVAMIGFAISFLACYVLLRGFERQKIFFRI